MITNKNKQKFNYLQYTDNVWKQFENLTSSLKVPLQKYAEQTYISSK